MGTIVYVCPTNGREVDTGIEIDLVSFASLYGEQVGCPECLEVHRLAKIKAGGKPPWVTDKAPPWVAFLNTVRTERFNDVMALKARIAGIARSYR